MAKAVLVMDMPEDCKQCVFCRGLNACKLKKYLVRDKICTVYTVDKQIMEGGKPYWCPLRGKWKCAEHTIQNIMQKAEKCHHTRQAGMRVWMRF